MATAALLLDAGLMLLVLLGAAWGMTTLPRAGGGAGSLSLRQARRNAIGRTATALLVAAGVFAIALLVQVSFPEWQGVPLFVGPTAGAGIALLVFGVLPAVPIEGDVSRRTAVLVRRSVRELLPGGLRVLTFGAGAGAVAAALAGGLSSKAAVGDGRFLCTSLFIAACPPGGPYLYPGWHFSVPVLASLAVLAVGAAVAFRRVILLPAAAWRELADADRALRSNTAHVLAWVVAAPLLLTLGMFLGAAGVPLFNAAALDTGLSDASADAVSTAGLILILLGAGGMLAGLGAVFTAAILGIRVARLEPRPSHHRQAAEGEAASA
jgi:hypothetical protein